MDNGKIRRANARKKRMMRVRRALRGTGVRPRLSVLKTNAHIYAQLINDEQGVTLAGIGTLSEGHKMRRSKDAARHIGQQIAELAKKCGVQAVLFDRGRYKYHGIVAELASAAREAGLQF